MLLIGLSLMLLTWLATTPSGTAADGATCAGTRPPARSPTYGRYTLPALCVLPLSAS